MSKREIIQTIEESGIAISPIAMKGPVGLAAEKIHLGLAYEAIEAQIVRFDSKQDLLDKCRSLKDQGIVSFKPYEITEELIRGAFIPYVEITKKELKEIIQDLSIYYELM